MNDYNPWVIEIDNEFIITTKNPLPLGHFIEKIQTSDGEVIYSGKYRVVSCDRAPGSYPIYYRITLKKIDGIINIEELI